MENQGENQQTQQGPNNGNSHMSRSMREYMHPQRIGMGSCIVLPNEPIVIKTHLVPLLPQFHGVENENPYTHIKDFEEVCHTFQEGIASIELMRLKLFPFTLKDKAKLWFNSLRSQSIRSWLELQTTFLKKFFPIHRTSGLKRQITNFVALDNEKFYACWERYMEVVSACPHHGFDTWMLVSYFYEGMSPTMKQLLETMCGGDFMSKSLDEAFEFLNYVAEISRSWDEPHERDLHKSKSQSNSKGRMYMLNEDVDLQAKMIALTKRLEELEAKGFHEVNAIYDNPIYMEQCSNCQSIEHEVSGCPTIPSMGERLVENHLNMSWNCGQEQFSSRQHSQSQQFMEDSPQQVSLVEQAIVNLSKILGDFIGDQKNINIKVNQRIDHVETSFNQKFDSLQTNLTQRIDNMQLAISKLTSMHTVQEKGKFSSQPQQNPSGVHEIGETSESFIEKDEVKAVITLRGGKQVDQPMPKPKENKGEEQKENVKEQEKGKEVNEDDRSKEDEIVKEEVKKKDMLLAPPFPKALQSKKVVNNALEIFEVLKQVKVNIPLLDMIRQVPTYAKFLKDLCTIKRGMHLKKKAFLTEQVSAIIQCKTPIKYKDPGCPTISVNIGNTFVKRALLDLGASVNLLPYSFPRGIIEDVLIQIDNFYYPVDFVVLDTEQGTSGLNHVPIILGRPFLATANVLINCRSGVMQFTFGNMTIELNIFHSCKKHGTKEEEELKEAYLIELPMEELVKEKVEDNFSKLGEVISNELIEVWRINEEIQPLKLMKWSFSFKKVKTMKHGVHNNPKTMKKKLKEWHDQLIQKNKFKEGYFKPHIFPGKLKYQGVGPFIVCKPYPN
ncbi:hypothetical protein CK203_090068 [Vitis vinifera]|uniref:Retrotransposon gag domain-containing protein n=1 Tax=Vitis vinifera TaxID=29760 RepID=A0A438E5W7_VITVI|nr:hypothetical protein CK203_090068 [Vitis vinifera]